MSVAFVPAKTLDLAARARLFTASYEEYVVAFAVDEERLPFFERAFGTDLDRSLVATVGGEGVGLANLALDGEDGWVAGVGVVKPHRGTGLGRALMQELIEEARSAGVRRLWLEVIVENTRARTLYERLGFEHVRLLDVWRLPGAPAETPLAALEDALAFVRAHRASREPWQRTDATVERLRALEPPPGGLVVEGGAAVVRVAGDAASLVQLAATSEAGYDRLVAAARGLAADVVLLNLPDDDPARAAVARAAGEPAMRQHEMVLEL